MTGLNENHKRRILVSLQYADSLLQDSLNLLTSGSQLLFPRAVPNLSSADFHWIESYAQKIREQMTRLTERLDLKAPPPSSPSSWILRTNLTTLDVALEDLYPEQMTGYGAIDPQAARDLAWVVEELRRLVGQLIAYLDQARAARSGKIQETGTGSAGLLERMEEIISRYRLVEFLPILEAIQRKMQSHRFEIAVFGRVSSGKSSLINRLLGIGILPVGSTPITAVPISIVAGMQPELRVECAGHPAEILPVERLREFASEQENPRNRKRVIALEVMIPTRSLHEGVAFVDTPGVASLASTGTELSLAYLPNCDLGFVLIDAHASVAHEDLDLLRSLRTAGIASVVLLSKCDQLSKKDIENVHRYTHDVIAEQLGYSLDVVPISSVVAWAPHVEAWFKQVVAPLLEESRQALVTSIARKMDSARRLLLATLELKLEALSARGTPPRLDTEEFDRVLRPFDERLRDFHLRWDNYFAGIVGRVDEILEEMAVQLAESAKDNRSEAQPLRFSAGDTLIRSVTSRCQPLLREYNELAAGLGLLLVELGDQHLDSLRNQTDSPRPSALPLPDTSTLEGITFAFPGLLATLAHFSRLGFFRKEVETKAASAVREALEELSPRLAHWVRTTVDRLESQYHLQTDPLRYRSLLPNAKGSSDSIARIQEDIRVLCGEQSFASVSGPSSQESH